VVHFSLDVHCARNWTTRNILFILKCHVMHFLQYGSETPVVTIRGYDYTVLFAASDKRWHKVE
jgi:hypothetical protein